RHGHQFTHSGTREQHLDRGHVFHLRPRARPLCLSSSSETGCGCVNSPDSCCATPRDEASSTSASRVICPVVSKRLMVDSETPARSANVLRERFCAKRSARAFSPTCRVSSPGEK